MLQQDIINHIEFILLNFKNKNYNNQLQYVIVPEQYVIFLNYLYSKSIKMAIIPFKLCFCALDNEV